MGKIVVERRVPYPPAQMFDLVADVERYPEFLPFWIAVRVERREGNRQTVSQIFGWQGLRWSVRTHTRLWPVRSIEVTSRDRPFRQVRLSWRFEPVAGEGTLVRFAAHYELRAGVLSFLLERVFASSLRRLTAAFEIRAAALSLQEDRPQEESTPSADRGCP